MRGKLETQTNLNVKHLNPSPFARTGSSFSTCFTCAATASMSSVFVWATWKAFSFVSPVTFTSTFKLRCYITVAICSRFAPQ